MKKIIILLLISHFTNLFSQVTYLDEDDKIITEKEYNYRQISYGKLKVCNDSLQKCKIISSRSEVKAASKEGSFIYFLTIC